MNEMSLRQQIKQLENLIDYLHLVKREAENLNSQLSDTLDRLRKNGLRTETVELIREPYLGVINQKLNEMLSRMQKEDQRYLKETIKDLQRVANNK